MNLKAEGVKATYARSMKNMVMEFVEYASDHGITNGRQVAKELIIEFHQYILTRPLKKRSGTLSSSMIRQILQSLNSFFKFLLKMDLIEENPMDGFLLPKGIQRDRVVPTEEEVNAIISECENLTDYTIILLAYGCGLRRSEIERLDLDGVNIRSGILRVMGKGGKIRRIQLTERITRELQNYVLHERPKYNRSLIANHRKAFMLSERGFRMKGNTLNKRLKALTEKAGIEKQITLHSLRHAIATVLLDRGMRLEKVQEYLSHRWIDTTVIYTKFTKRRI